MLKTLKNGYKICLKQKEFTEALRIALKLNDMQLIKEVFELCTDRTVQKQLSFQIARQRVNIPLDEDLTKITSNSMLNEFYIKLAKDLDVLEPKHPDQIYKTYLDDRKSNLIINSF